MKKRIKAFYARSKGSSHVCDDFKNSQSIFLDTVYLSPEEIVYASSIYHDEASLKEGTVVYTVKGDRRYVNHSLAQLVEMLPSTFIKVHKSYAVDLSKVRSTGISDTNLLVEFNSDKPKYKLAIVGRDFKNEVRQYFNSLVQ